MQANREQFSMRSMCTALKVSRSGYYAWCNRDKSPCLLSQAIARQFEQDKARAGAPSIAHALAQSGMACSVRTVGRRMQRLGLRVRYAKKFKRAADTIRRIRSIFTSGSVQRELIVLDEVVSSTLAFLDKTIRTQKVEMDCQLHAPLPFVFGKGEIEHILINLIQNSLDALHLSKNKEGKISITTQHTADNVTLMVSDNGPGIAIERVPKIFHMYESDKINGLGLGLWLTKHIAERNGAVLYYDPQSQDGACFVLTCSTSPNL